MAHEDTSPATVDPRQRVLDLDVVRQERGHKAGWLYYQRRDGGLLDAYQASKAEGRIGGGGAGRTEALLVVAGETRPRLTIDLVPATCRFSDVRSEVSEADWERLKRITFAQANCRCQVCGGRGRRWPVECHELWH